MIKFTEKAKKEKKVYDVKVNDVYFLKFCVAHYVTIS